MIAICLLFATATLFGQTESKWLMKVHIPFSFNVVDRPMPGGIYNVYTVGSERIVRITNVDGKHTAIVNTQPNYSTSVSPAAHLAFMAYADEYALTQIWVGGEDFSRNLSLGKKATELARAGNVARTTVVGAIGDNR
jgi:hypothetical protein